MNRHISPAAEEDVAETLPFVADIPVPGKPRESLRSWWVVPAVPEDDYGDACRIGAVWAAQYIDYEVRHGGYMCMLTTIVRAMGESESLAFSSRGGSTGFAVGFLSALLDLAVAGAKAYGGALEFGRRKEDWYRRMDARRAALRAAEIREQVARMNAGRAARRAIKAAKHRSPSSPP